MNMLIAETKKQLGQFFTVNSDYILQDLAKYIKGKSVVDPFAGSGDLLVWANSHEAGNVKGFDVDKKYIDNKLIFFNDNILQPQTYQFVITNPPYLNVNKAGPRTKNTYFKNSGYEDLYQMSLKSLLNTEEGIVIVPVNFLCAENSAKIRNEFFSKFRIVEMNYFKHQVFPDTTYNVIAFYYKRIGKAGNDKFIIKTRVYPEGNAVNIEVCKDYGWLVGGDLVAQINNAQNYLKIRRLTESDMQESRGSAEIECFYNHTSKKKKWGISPELLKQIKSNIILLKAIDSGTEGGKIALVDIRDHGLNCLVSKSTSRHMIYLIFGQPISIEKQKKLIKLFNKEIERLRLKYMSLFLTNYRDKDRKRIGFDFAYKFINYLYNKHINQSSLF